MTHLHPLGHWRCKLKLNQVRWLSCVFPAVQVISAELRSSKHWELTEEGTEIAEQGSHEARVFNAVPLEGLAQSELMVSATGEHNILNSSKTEADTQINIIKLDDLRWCFYSVGHKVLICLRVETVLREDRLQQGHVQQVDPSRQDTRGRAEDIQDCTCLFIRTCCCSFLCPRSQRFVSVFGSQVETIVDQVREKLLVQKGNASQLEEKEKNELKKRKLLSEV